MSDAALIVESLRLLLIGMGTVFAVLLLLVALLRGMSGLIHWLAPPGPTANPAAEESTLVAVLTAAVARYRAARRPPRGP